ncbi:hypothetical protein [Leptolyngbya sp. NIES-2104]|uniref:hypothetical protein n=1 Tax=Leptolyngbya sp. NIES-2104 TaxID=1552121 RepID=UPI0006ECC3B6|nr:hypothetical protein [Leptolyngbya sp. NIES-2104]GAQ00010.1 hypothetical protein NIES2104_65750 [Leptolyngbya sp. NIES-2104]
MAKTWQEKLNAKKQPKLQIMEKPMAGVSAGGTLFFPTPQLIKEFIDTIPEGQSMLIAQLRQQLAQAHQGDNSCPLSTSTSARIVAEAAWEEIEAGKASEQVTPFWRVIEPDSSLAQKLACGSEFIEAMRKQEGI